MKSRTISYDPSVDVLWITYRKGTEEYYKEIAPGTIIEYDKDDQVLGLEIQNYIKDLKTELVNNPISSEKVIELPATISSSNKTFVSKDAESTNSESWSVSYAN